MAIQFPENFDVIVIGGGHAGTEAALAASRTGARCLLLTHNIDTIGQMSCNPAIGGIGKSHLVKEIDALGGAMATATDFAGIQFRTLNARKGPAVRATRAQTDRALYKAAIRQLVEQQDNLFLFQQAADDLVIDKGIVTGVITQSGIQFSAKTVVLTAGTFLGGRIHIGLNQQAGGRAGDAPSIALANRLRSLPFRVARLKTGTPPRIDASTVDFTGLEEQWGDQPTPLMSFLGQPEQHPQQRCCWITYTNEQTHEIIRNGLDRSPLYTGVIEGNGPRYCPSIEDKVHRFSDRPAHQIFIEPEGLNTRELYPNGISTSLPFDVQLQVVRSIAGFEQAHMTRPGYAIEYDFFDPRDLHHSLETRFIGGLFFAGQINGTTGYEEAAAQGLLAGLNAARKAGGQAAWEPRRDEAYLGVMVDDLISMGTLEPYRMFTSRAEHRLSLREDNADLRLTAIGRELGLVDASRWRAFCDKRASLANLTEKFRTTRVRPGSEAAQRLDSLLPHPVTRDHSLMDLLKRPELDYAAAAWVLEAVAGEQQQDVDRAVSMQLEIEAKYSGYIERQRAEIEKNRQHENTRIPDDFDYRSVTGLSTEIKQILGRARPETLARAARLPGVTPAAMSLLLITLKKRGLISNAVA